MRPLIGITPQVDPDSGILKLHPNYFSALAHSGAQGVLLPLTEDSMQLEQFAERLDGFLLSGGPDPHPALYGELPIPAAGELILRVTTWNVLCSKRCFAGKNRFSASAAVFKF